MGCREWWFIWRRAQPQLLPPAPKASEGKGLASASCHFAFSLLSPTQNQFLEGKETNKCCKIMALEECPSSWIAHSLLSLAPLCLRPFASEVLVPGHRSSGSVGPLWLSQSKGEPMRLENIDQLLRPTELLALGLLLTPPPCCPPLPLLPWPFQSCLAPIHVQLENNWHVILHWTMLFPCLSKPSCFFKASLALQMHFNNGTYSD